MSKPIVIVRIDGVPAGRGLSSRAALCCPGVPPYATGSDEYYHALADYPSGLGARWDITRQTLTLSQVTIQLMSPEAIRAIDSDWPVEWWALAPRPIGECRGTWAASETTGTTNIVPDVSAGLSAGDYLWIERECVHVDDNSPFTVARGQAGTEDVDHVAGADVYDAMPFLIGRKIEIYMVDGATATSSADERLVASGYVTKEPAGRFGTFDIQAQIGHAGWMLGTNPQSYAVARWRDRSAYTMLGPPHENYRPDSDGGLVALPRFHDDGATWYFPDEDVVLVATYSASEGWLWSPAPVMGDYADLFKEVDTGTGPALRAYQVAWSLGDYHPWGYDVSSVDVPSIHPIDVLLNHLLSTEAGDNYTGSTSWDRGSRLASDWAPGVPVGQVNVELMLAVRDGILAGVRADDLWIGGPEKENFAAFTTRLLAPLGMTLGVDATGTYTLLWLGDSYPGELVTLGDSQMGRHAQWTVEGVTRPMHAVTVMCAAGPSHRGGVPIDVTEDDGKVFYDPRLPDPGGADKIEDAPYLPRNFSDKTAGFGSRLLRSRLRRLATRSVLVHGSVLPSYRASVPLGAKVSLSAPGLMRNIRTGVKTNAAQSGIIAESPPEVQPGAAQVTVLLGGESDGRARVGPSARVVSYEHTTATLTVEATAYSPDDDATRFAEGAEVILVSRRNVLLSTVATATIDSVAPETIVLEAHWQDGSGDMDGQSGRNEPAEGDVVILASYDDSRAEEKEQYGYAGAPEGLGAGNEPLYRWGD